MVKLQLEKNKKPLKKPRKTKLSQKQKQEQKKEQEQKQKQKQEQKKEQEQKQKQKQEQKKEQEQKQKHEQKKEQEQEQKQNVTVNINKATRPTPQPSLSQSKVIQRAPQNQAPSSYTNLSFSQPAGNSNSSLMLRELFSVNKELEKKINQLEKAQPRSNFQRQLAGEYSQANQQLDEQDVTNEYTIIDQPQARAQRAQQERVIRRTIPDNPLLRGLRDVVGPSYQVVPSGIFREQLEATLGPNVLPFVTSSSAPRSGIGSLNQVTNISKEGRLENAAYLQQAQTETRPRAVEQPELKEPYNSVEASLRRAQTDGIPAEGTPILERIQEAEDHSNDPEIEEGQGVETYAEAPNRSADGQAILGEQQIPNRIEAFIAENQTTGDILEEQRGEQVGQLAGYAQAYAAEADEDGEYIGAGGGGGGGGGGGAAAEEDDQTVEGLGAASSGASAATENIFTPPKAQDATTTFFKGFGKAAAKLTPNQTRNELRALAKGTSVSAYVPGTGKNPRDKPQQQLIDELRAIGVDVSSVTGPRK